MIINNFAVFGKYFYYDLKHILRAFNLKETKECFDFIEKNKNDLYCLMFADYELYQYFQDKNLTSKKPYLSVFAFTKRKRFENKILDQERFIPEFISFLDQTNYEKNFIEVKKAIAKGRVYQLNLTQSFYFKSKMNAFNLFKLLLSRQNTSLKAFIKDENREILSFSPELFFKIKNRKITTKPMKGTIKRDQDPIKDQNNKFFLQNDEKNISENVMICDLLRNDLAKIIKKNTLKTKLFKIQSHPTLHQMTSSVKGKLKKNISLYQIFKALFPCGSITGAPKLESIKFIQELEQKERGIYCGSIGLAHKNKATFNVAIRTLEKQDEIYKYSTGSGLVWDSKMQEEFEELQLKSAILNPCEFYLFETMYFKNNTVLFFKEHLQRLINSALKYNFNLNNIFKDFHDILSEKKSYLKFHNLTLFELNEKIFHHNHSLFYPFIPPFKNSLKEGVLKLILHKNGKYELKQDILKSNSSDILFLSNEKIYSKSDNLFHKTSLRTFYEKHAHKWRENLCYDIVFFNEKKELCEGSRSNIILEKNKHFYTPKLQSGMLNGVYRNFLLKLKFIEEKKLFKQDLFKADNIYCINSVRGLKKVKLP
ncbi:bifunctional anthranilate synthase component I family protein/aminotransferase class IV [Campylobacter hepaticus]|uniref:bifunctional anthranilate synthase component I family protein/aminotransferase class IV n=1 Tax=Campylobacter hepaticus TaxID=1813019 RepID=UPI0029ABE077|nr:bifunctional anthranilate synthase component I family protein/aminotransferase class IV [Campylobacter hepaticus]MDX2331186.1 bifunctional anthranilate synthase component I family protein/aminotransferase class IV [Campylobacter hepaticus]MDX2371801.1 bifunctional anthranilate synthase component I family protein/aminotransferase class IV [Campylobacter hepaticus]MDX2396994.1 bifunctional anthranilate synthase component I family protein/aminotransferase class IV [Campylobacter hepaticus]MDX55